MHRTTLFQKNSNGKIKFIEIHCEHNSVFREWGLLNGKTQSTSNQYRPINGGKANELTACEAALADYHRIIKRKIKEGYTEDIEAVQAPPSSIDLSNIPTAFCCSKPKATITPAQLQTLIDSGNAKFFIKYNGLCHYILVDPNGQIKLFTRRWDDHTRKYPHIVKAVEDIGYLPGTLLIAEFVIDPLEKLPHMEVFSIMSSISKSDTKAGTCKEELPKTFALQKDHLVRAAVFGILYFEGKQVWHKPYSEILENLLIHVPVGSKTNPLFVPREVPIASAEMAIDLAKKNKTQVEGFVVWDTTQAMKVTLNGKPDRCAAWKVKAKGEKDVIAIGWEEGKGHLQGKIGALKIGQYDPQGNMIDLGTVAGLKPKKGECDPENWTFPCVIEVEYDQIFPDTGRFQFGHFVKVHEDKLPEDIETLSL
jgi:predicted DNA-binding WGR domain protein